MTTSGVEEKVYESGDAILRAQLEALLIVADEAISAEELAIACDVSVGAVREALTILEQEYTKSQRGFELREIGAGFRFYARTEHDELISRFYQENTMSRLSQPALETLTVIAYRQPISRAQIASIRAVNVDSVVRTLLRRGLIHESGEDAETGAILYRTTDLLLESLGIRSLEELPPIAHLLDDGAEGFEGE